MAGSSVVRGFDITAFFDALDERRQRDGLSWAAVAREMAAMSALPAATRTVPHPIAASTITGMTRRNNTTCQHAVVMLRWLGVPPEDFIADPVAGTAGVALASPDAQHSLRWDLVELYDALDELRRSRGATWARTAERLRCSPAQLTGLRTARYATNMRLAMRICQGLGRPAADFVHPATW